MKKTKIKIWIQLSMIAVFSVLLVTNCTKDNENPNNSDNQNNQDNSDEKEPIVNESTVTDADGNVYSTLTIGDFMWLGENLKTTKYNDSTDIPNLIDNNEWGNLSSDAYCWYNNSPGDGIMYGALYNWHAVNTKKLCPTGWHVATDDEWTELVKDLGGNDIIGDKLKESAFKALLGGLRSDNGDFSWIGSFGNWWTATETDTDHALYVNVGENTSLFLRADYDKRAGFSVRCVRD